MSPEPTDRRPPSAARRFLADASPATGALGALLAAIVLLWAVLVWALGLAAAPAALEQPDACDYAQLGRQIQGGEGFSSLQSFPYILAWLGARGEPTAPPWPNVSRFVLPTLTRALSFSIVGAGDRGARLPGALYFVATAVAVFLLGNRLFGPVSGVVGAALFTASDRQLETSVSGLAEPGAAFFVVSSALVWSRLGDRDDRGGWGHFGLGLLLGLAYLQRTNLVVLGLAASLLLVTRGRWRSAAIVLGGWLAVTGPWLLRNALDHGSPFLSLTNHRALALGLLGRDPFHGFELQSPARLLFDNAGVILGRLHGSSLLERWDRALTGQIRWAGLLFLLAGVVAGSPRVRRVWLFALAAALPTGIGVTALFLIPRFLVPFTPLLLVFAVGGVHSLLRRLPPHLHLAIPAVALCAGAAASGTLADAWKRQPSIHWQPVGAAVDRLVPHDAVIASDRSWMIAWHLGRPSLRFFGSVPKLHRIDREYAPVGAVVLTGPRAKAFERDLASSPLREALRPIWRSADGTVVWVRREPRGRSGGIRH